MQTVFSSTAAARFLDELRNAGGATAGDLITGAVYRVLSTDGEVAVDAADRALVAVTLLAVERAPEVLDGAPDPDGLRDYLADLDTELTPARITAAQGVLGRLLVPAANAWYDAHNAAGTLPAAQQDVRRLVELLADADSV
jgi:hypothetical protein